MTNGEIRDRIACRVPRRGKVLDKDLGFGGPVGNVKIRECQEPPGLSIHLEAQGVPSLFYPHRQHFRL